MCCLLELVTQCLDGQAIEGLTMDGIDDSLTAENRPVLWECGTTNIVMSFDRMGRRVEYVEMVSGVTNTHHRFVYDGYLCIQRLNAASNNAIDLVFGWDPSEPVATRPLVLQKYGQYNLFYTHDMRPRRRRRVARRSVATEPRSGRKRPRNKNVSELVFFQQANGIAAHYEYAPFGAVTATSKSTPVTAYDFCMYNPFRFSSEYADNALGLVYYNYRHYNPVDGRWTSRDVYNIIPNCDYLFMNNAALLEFDYLGRKGMSVPYARTLRPRAFKKRNPGNRRLSAPQQKKGVLPYPEPTPSPNKDTIEGIGNALDEMDDKYALPLDTRELDNIGGDYERKYLAETEGVQACSEKYRRDNPTVSKANSHSSNNYAKHTMQARTCKCCDISIDELFYGYDGETIYRVVEVTVYADMDCSEVRDRVKYLQNDSNNVRHHHILVSDF